MPATDRKRQGAPLKVLLCSSEMEPFAKTGGLGDVTAALSKSLARLGHEVKVFLPKYKSVYQTGVSGLSGGAELNVAVNGTDLAGQWEIYQDKRDGFEVVFVVNDELYLRDEIYMDRKTGMDYADNDTRFIFLCRAILEICKQLDWRPDIIHANDWQTGLTTVLLKTVYADDDFFAKTRSTLTIHNAGYQGVFNMSTLRKIGLDPKAVDDLSLFRQGGKFNFLKSSITHADVLAAVSERYAVEIQSSKEYGCGLERILRGRNGDLFGVLNGVDYERWNPASDKLIPHNYDHGNLKGKAKNKAALQKRLDLKSAPKTPILCMINRLTEQKGIELFLEIADDILRLDVQMVVLGDGEDRYVQAFSELQRAFPDNFRAVIGFDEKLAHLIEAGSDIFLMPSRYEPCGLNQMYSLRYGTPPVVRETGGLADTISEYDPATGEGVGFLFQNFSSDELLEALCRALDLYPQRKQWERLMQNGMAQDFSWERSARRYEELYRLALSKKSREPVGATA